MQMRLVTEGEAGALAGVYRDIRRSMGVSQVPYVFQAMASMNADVLLQNWTAWKRTLLTGVMPRLLKEKVALVAAREQESAYAQALHRQALVALGAEPGVVADLASAGDSDKLPGRERALMRWTRSYAEAPDHTSPVSLEAAGFSDDEVQQVVDTVLLVQGMGYFATEAELPLDGDLFLNA